MYRSLLFALAAGSLFAQTPAFEVAAIKPAPPMASLLAQIISGKVHVGMRVEADRVDIGNMSLLALIQAAYRVKPYQVSGPAWMSEEMFDILAKIPEGASRDQVPEMLQALLSERFKLTIHRENRDHAVYALVVGKGGPKLKEATAPEADAAPAADPPQNGFTVDTPNGKMVVTADKGGAVATGSETGTIRVSAGPDHTVRMETERMTMAGLADRLSSMLDRPVFDLTELKGHYQVTLDLAREDLIQVARAQGINVPFPMSGRGGNGAAPGVASDPSGSSVFESVQKLGLRLEPRKMPIDLIVVDHLEKSPTDN